MSYTVRLINAGPAYEVRIGHMLDALRWAKELHAEHSNRWVDIRNDANELVLLLEPKQIGGEPSPHTQLELL